MPPEILTVGHSTHPIERFLALLLEAGVEAVADVRRFPGSRRHPGRRSRRQARSLPLAALARDLSGALPSRGSAQ